MKVVVSLLNYNNAEETKECLLSLTKIKRNGFSVETILIDNASKEPFNIKEEDYQSISLTVFKNSLNLGFAGGHNLSFRFALQKKADFVLVLNNDTLLDSDFLSYLVASLQANDKIGIAAPKIYYSKGSEYHKMYSKEDLGKVIWYAGGKIDWQNVNGSHIGVDEVDSEKYNRAGITEFATGCCMLIKLDALKKTGFFDERYFLYFEDLDLNVRMKKNGYQVCYEPKAFIWHKNASSTGGSGSSIQDYFVSRNRLLFGGSYAPFRTKVALLKESFWLLKNGRPMQRLGIRDYFLRRFGKGSLKI